MAPRQISNNKPILKPLMRGHFHQAAFFIALGACAMLLARSHDVMTSIAILIYSLSLISLFGISALYHRIHWRERARAWMRRLDHSAIFFLIAGTGTPICLLGIPGDGGNKLLVAFWVAATAGILQSLVWIKAPKWISAILYVAMGWIVSPFLSELQSKIGPTNITLLVTGGIIYSLGALVYAAKLPNPSPKFFGYHEIFHVMVVIAAGCHFVVVSDLVG